MGAVESGEGQSHPTVAEGLVLGNTKFHLKDPEDKCLRLGGLVVDQLHDRVNTEEAFRSRRATARGPMSLQEISAKNLSLARGCAGGGGWPTYCHTGIFMPFGNRESETTRT